MGLGRESSYHQCPKSTPKQQLNSCAEPSWGHTLTREHSGVQICLIHILREEICQPWICPNQDKEPSHSLTPCGEFLPALADREGWRHSCELYRPAALEMREGPAEPVVCEALVLLARELCVGVNLSKENKQRALLTLELFLPLHLGRESNL